MKILCWNINESVWLHWCNVIGDAASMTRTLDKQETLTALANGQYDYCFAYLEDQAFSRKVEDMVDIRAAFPDLKIIVFPYLRSQAAGMRMLAAGINAQCSPFAKREQLDLVMSVVNSGEVWCGKEFIQGLIQQNAHTIPEQNWQTDPLECLSEREHGVALLVAKGLSNKAIAGEMTITERTVKAHLTAIYKKVAVKDRLALALLMQNRVKSSAALTDAEAL